MKKKTKRKVVADKFPLECRMESMAAAVSLIARGIRSINRRVAKLEKRIL